MTRAATIASLLAFGLAGCIKAAEDPPPLEVMCVEDDECPTGHCHDGVCVGPAQQEFAAVLVPPEGRLDLASTELQSLEIDEEGLIHGLSFEDTIEVSGRVVLSLDPTKTGTSIGARLVFRRPSRIPGVGDYIVRAVADRGLGEGETAFSVRLPRPPVDEVSGLVVAEEWELSIYPDDGTVYDDYDRDAETDTPPPPADLAPPDRLTLLLEGDYRDAVFPLVREGGLKWIHGYVQDASGRAVEGMQVRAYGRYAPGRSLEIASSTGLTDADGFFTVQARVEWDDTFELEARPTGDLIAPVIRRHDVYVDDPPAGIGGQPFLIDPIRFPAFALPQPFSLPVVGISSGGTLTDPAGTVVQLTTSLPSDAGDIVTFTASGIVGLDGTTQVQLIPGGDDGNRVYQVTAIPPQGSPLGVVFDATVEVGLYEGTLAELDLPPRLYVTGHVDDADGVPASFVLVRAVLAPSLTLRLDADELKRLDGLLLPEGQTDENGDFSFYLDPAILGRPAEYDLEIVPPDVSWQPRWIAPLNVPDSADQVYASGTITLPGATYAWGAVLDPDGELVSGADLRVYTLPSGELCATLQVADCAAPARLMAQAKSDAEGELTVALPDRRPD